MKVDISAIDQASCNLENTLKYHNKQTWIWVEVVVLKLTNVVKSGNKANKINEYTRIEY